MLAIDYKLNHIGQSFIAKMRSLEAIEVTECVGDEAES